MRYQSVDCAFGGRLSSGAPGRAPTPESPPRNPISDRLRLPVPRSGYRKKGWRVAQPKDPPAPSLGYLVMAPLVESEAYISAPAAPSPRPADPSPPNPTNNADRGSPQAPNKPAPLFSAP